MTATHTTQSMNIQKQIATTQQGLLEFVTRITVGTNPEKHTYVTNIMFVEKGFGFSDRTKRE